MPFLTPNQQSQSTEGNDRKRFIVYKINWKQNSHQKNVLLLLTKERLRQRTHSNSGCCYRHQQQDLSHNDDDNDDVWKSLARLQTWRAIIFSRVCLSVCLSLTGTSTLQRWPILMKLGHKDPTLIWFGRDHNGQDRPQRDRATPFWKFQKILKNYTIRISKFWSIIFCVCVSCVL